MLEASVKNKESYYCTLLSQHHSTKTEGTSEKKTFISHHSPWITILMNCAELQLQNGDVVTLNHTNRTAAVKLKAYEELDII